MFFGKVRGKTKPQVIPGFGITLGFSVLYLSLMVLIPLSTIFMKSSSMGWEKFLQTVTDPRVVASYQLSFGTSLLAAAVNAIFGTLLAWVLVRYTFPYKRIVDGLVDLPFALPTAVAGISLTALYSENGWVGKYLAEVGLKVAYTPLGITVALTFIGLPFVVRMVQPVLQNISQEVEEAAGCLGANRFQTFIRIILPEILPAVITGFGLAFARALGEYGSVVFISGNMPMKTEITPLLIMSKLEQFDYPGATAIASVMLVISFLMLLAMNLLQWWNANRSQR